jgi:hypothetical protein
VILRQIPFLHRNRKICGHKGTHPGFPWGVIIFDVFMVADKKVPISVLRMIFIGGFLEDA